MVHVRPLNGRDQELINSVLRPYKRRFPRGPIQGAQTKMKQYGEKHLRTYRPQSDYRWGEIFLSNLSIGLSQINLNYSYPTYYNFTLEQNVTNYQVPREGRSVRVTTTEGEPIILGRKKVRSGQFRLHYRKISYDEQLVRAFGLFDEALTLLEKVF